MNLPYRKRSVFYFSCLSVTIFEEGFCRMYVTICGRFRLDEGAVTGYGSRIRVKYTTKWDVQIADYPQKGECRHIRQHSPCIYSLFNLFRLDISLRLQCLCAKNSTTCSTSYSVVGKSDKLPVVNSILAKSSD